MFGLVCSNVTSRCYLTDLTEWSSQEMLGSCATAPIWPAVLINRIFVFTMIQFSSLFLNRLENVHIKATDGLKYLSASPSRSKGRFFLNPCIKDPKSRRRSQALRTLLSHVSASVIWAIDHTFFYGFKGVITHAGCLEEHEKTFQVFSQTSRKPSR